MVGGVAGGWSQGLCVCVLLGAAVGEVLWGAGFTVGLPGTVWLQAALVSLAVLPHSCYFLPLHCRWTVTYLGRRVRVCVCLSLRQMSGASTRMAQLTKM